MGQSVLQDQQVKVEQRWCREIQQLYLSPQFLPQLPMIPEETRQDKIRLEINKLFIKFFHLWLSKGKERRRKKKKKNCTSGQCTWSGPPSKGVSDSYSSARASKTSVSSEMVSATPVRSTPRASAIVDNFLMELSRSCKKEERIYSKLVC